MVCFTFLMSRSSDPRGFQYTKCSVNSAAILILMASLYSSLSTMAARLSTMSRSRSGRKSVLTLGFLPNFPNLDGGSAPSPSPSSASQPSSSSSAKLSLEVDAAFTFLFFLRFIANTCSAASSCSFTRAAASFSSVSSISLRLSTNDCLVWSPTVCSRNSSSTFSPLAAANPTLVFLLAMSPRWKSIPMDTLNSILAELVWSYLSC
mmetsp:Transcript_23555/g.57710  ORF Transcript_23555/g.57710 Transcript_23555/m.57710 type:complete len:206 (-) Transcript_23555:86-703(-)